MKALVGMSGGVDSSVAAYLLKDAGYEVEGLSLLLYEARGGDDSNVCCSLQAVRSASDTAQALGIKHGTVDVRGLFMEKVIEPFIDSYTKGVTPNPCILCNRHIKFPVLLEEAKKRGADMIATGHYARVVKGGKGCVLKAGLDPSKDQSYVLYILKQEELESLILPLGEFTKKEVREMAARLGLPAAEREESQEICFTGGKDYAGFLGAFSSCPSEGPICDESGTVLGIHKGLYRYTIGQRKGLSISSKRPLYVTKINVAENSVFVGAKEEAMSREFYAADLNWLLPPAGDFRADVKVRSMMKAQPASVHFENADNDFVKVLFDRPQWAPAPGQSAVFYEGNTVIGGGIIGAANT